MYDISFWSIIRENNFSKCRTYRTDRLTEMVIATKKLVDEPGFLRMRFNQVGLFVQLNVGLSMSEDQKFIY